MRPAARAVLLGAFVLGAAACASANTGERPATNASREGAPPGRGPGITFVSPDEADGGALPVVAADPPPVAPPAPAPTCAHKKAEAEPSAPKPTARFADRRADEALDRLGRLVGVTDERRGRVITLRTDDLGEPGGWALSPGGSRQVDELVDALREQEGRTILVSGYTDARGAPEKNDALSLLRAQAVCDRLAGRGVALQDLRVEGLGGRRPVRENATADGRAQNRRIEIVISR